MDNILTRKFIDFVSDIKSKKIVDIGCGDRQYERYISDSNKYIGVDVKESGRSLETKKADLYYNGVDLPFEDDSVDVVICTQVLEHAIAPEKLVKDMFRILKKDGYTYITIPFIWGEHETPYDFRRYTSFGIKKLFEDEGFVIEKQEKLDIGSKSIKKLLFSEIGFAKSNKNSFIERVKFKIMYKLFSISFDILDSTVILKRVHLDNLLIARKT